MGLPRIEWVQYPSLLKLAEALYRCCAAQMQCLTNQMDAACCDSELAAPKGKDPVCFRKTGSSVNSLTMSYFHTGTRTIIGAEAFHCPVRDGKEWDHLAMVIRLDLSPPSVFTQQPIHRSIRYFS